MLHRVIEEVAHWMRRDWSFADVGRHWDLVEDYDDINAETYSYYRRFIDGFRLSELTDGGRVLDLCARTGNGTLYLHEHGRFDNAICADVSRKMGDICTQRLVEAGVKNFSWLLIDDYTLPLQSGMFDTVLCFETVEHFAQPARLITELGRVTRPGGIMILTTPNVAWEPVHALAAITGWHHSEGPHRFIGYHRLMNMVTDARFAIVRAETTVLVPGGPKVLVRLGEWIEKRTPFFINATPGFTPYLDPCKTLIWPGVYTCNAGSKTGDRARLA
jgi:SAM-dependent methyltransferase